MEKLQEKEMPFWNTFLLQYGNRYSIETKIKGTPLWKALFFEKRLPWRYRELFKKKRLLPYVANKERIEIEITTDCNLRCINCDRSCRQAPSKENMTPEQVKKFVSESIDLKWKWNCITLIGGEPTLHPQLSEILTIIKEYKDINPDCIIEIATNGMGEKVNKVLLSLPGWIKIRSSHKKSGINLFDSYNVAPTDSLKYKLSGFNKGCWICEVDGMALTRYGYYSCGAGASVDRVFGFDIGIKSLSLVKDALMRKQQRLLCRYCGHYKKPRLNQAPHITGKGETSEIKSSSWVKAYEKYRQTPPSLTLY